LGEEKKFCKDAKKAVAPISKETLAFVQRELGKGYLGDRGTSSNGRKRSIRKADTGGKN